VAARWRRGGGAVAAQDLAGLLDLGALDWGQLVQMLAHPVGDISERGDLVGEVADDELVGVDRLGGFPVGLEGPDVVFEGRQIRGVGAVEAFRVKSGRVASILCSGP
jgi:hypothetical protein